MRQLKIRQRNGKIRVVVAPTYAERRSMRVVLMHLTREAEGIFDKVGDHIHGFRPHRNPVTNALAHKGAVALVNMDLRDFFDTVSLARIREGLELHRRLLPKGGLLQEVMHKAQFFVKERKRLMESAVSTGKGPQPKYASDTQYLNVPNFPNIKHSTAWFLGAPTKHRGNAELQVLRDELCSLLQGKHGYPDDPQQIRQCVSKKNALGARELRDVSQDEALVALQGLPTSPVFANIAALPMDKKILSFCKVLGAGVVYTRYADDLTISVREGSVAEINRALRAILDNVPQLVTSCRFDVHPDKIHVQRGAHQRMNITGVMLDPSGSLHASRYHRRRLRAAKHQRNAPQVDGLSEWCAMRVPDPNKPWPAPDSKITRALAGVTAEALKARS